MTTNPPFNRAPLNQGCHSPPNAPPSEVHDPCAMLPKLRAAYYALLAGAQSQEVRHGDMWQRWHKGEAKLLKQEIDRLSAICPRSFGGAGGRYATTMGGRGFNHPGY
ncbi:hypothetical protein IYX23_05310 [Methylocystis sp. L43]|uniref:hypothetical protein n=1 Tax=unclassified Methylocystis TaxID=2625913 RepID=UPI0018C29907|nr:MULTISPECIES: hypothetical protein [unclassified Methylocystis]MBG0797104.1 hypothetical protein [Methylocystis sp. L43]MBG0805025.1 hypothetical protein [Methylocystis sp. H15]